MIAAFFATLTPWRQFAVAFLLGAIAGLGLPPISFIPCVFIAFPGLLLLLDQTQRRPFLLGWGFGFGYFLISLYWVVFSLGVDLAKFFWLVPFALFVLPATIALYPALAVFLTQKSQTRGLTRCCILALSWVGLEWLRGHWFLAFPWNMTGYIWMPSESMLQLTAYMGIYGLSLLTVFVACLPSLWFEKPRSLHSRRVAPILAVAFLGLWGLGALRLYHAPPISDEGVMIRLVHPKI